MKTVYFLNGDMGGSVLLWYGTPEKTYNKKLAWFCGFAIRERRFMSIPKE
jgi:hypothetical protein